MPNRPVRASALAVLLVVVAVSAFAACATRIPDISRPPYTPGDARSPWGWDRPSPYVLHITRAANWFDAAQNPISEADWNSVVAAGQPELYVEHAGDPPDRPKMDEVFLGDPTGASVWWSGGQIEAKGLRNDDDVAALIRLATRLHARVQGDDGEFWL